VYGVVEQSNGTLKIDSQPGIGTAVHLFLPRSQESEDAVQERHEARSRERANARVLVVDDDAEVRQVTVEMLRQLGYEVAGVENGQAALDRLDRGETFDLLLIDIAMPGFSGFETVRRARRRWPDLRVLYATGFADLTGGGDGTGDDPRIKKPFHLADLSAAMRSAVGKR